MEKAEEKDKEVSRRGCCAGEGSSWHLTVRHVFLIVLVLRISIPRSLLYTKPWKQVELMKGRRREGQEFLLKTLTLDIQCTFVSSVIILPVITACPSLIKGQKKL